jgi:hypothetical protein
LLPGLFFDSNWNRDGEFRNQFELKSFSTGQVVIDAAVGLMWHPGGTPGFMSLEKAVKWLVDFKEGNVFSDFPNYGYIRPVRSIRPGGQ